MDETSPYAQVKTLEAQISTLLSQIDIDAAPAKEHKLIVLIKRQLSDVRLDVRDYEYADTRIEQSKHAEEARKRVESLQGTILAASEYNIFSAVDVALFTAKAQHIAAQLT